METDPLILDSRRCRLRGWSLKDRDDAYAVWSNAEVLRYVDPEAVWTDRSQAEAVLRGCMSKHGQPDFRFWAVELKETQRVVGGAALKPLEDEFPELWPRPSGARDLEIAYHLGQEVWGRGLASEVVSTVIAYAQGAMDFENIVGVVLPENKGSVRVLEKSGFDFVGEDPEHGDYLYLLKRA